MLLKMECHSKWNVIQNGPVPTYLPTDSRQQTAVTVVTVVSSETNHQNSLQKKSRNLSIFFLFFSQYFWKEQHDTFDN